MALSENVIKIMTFLADHRGENYTSFDLAGILDMKRISVDGCFTMGIQKKGWGERVNATVLQDDGTTKEVKFLTLNDAGVAAIHDPEIVG